MRLHLQSIGLCWCGQYLKPCLARSLKAESLESLAVRTVAGTERERLGTRRGDMYAEKLGGSIIVSGGKKKFSSDFTVPVKKGRKERNVKVV